MNIFRFEGKWMITSKCTSVSAPLGVDAFGGKAVYESALKDVNGSISYASKFNRMSEAKEG